MIPLMMNCEFSGLLVVKGADEVMNRLRDLV